MTTDRIPRDAGRLFNQLETRVGRLERRGRGFSIPPAEQTGGIVASATPPPAPSDPNTLWIDTDDGNRIYRWNGSQWVTTMDPAVDLDRNAAATQIASWQDAEATADGLVTLYRQSGAPSAGLVVGDLWVDSDDDQLYRWSGSAWGGLSDTKLGELLAKQSLASTVADGRVRTWWQFGEPTATGFGDLWVKTSDSPATLWRWNNFDWIQVLDWSVLLQQEQLDTKISTWYLPSPPTSTAVGDLWYDTNNDNHPYRAETIGAMTIAAGQWVSVRDGSIQEAAAAASDALAQANAAMTAAEAAQAAADGAITSYYDTDPPWADGATGHDDDLGDLWYDTDTNQAYRWDGSMWALIQDNAIAEALAAAQDAQTTADGKITAYYLPTAPVTADSGDLWYDTDDQNKPYYWDGDSWELIRDESIDEALDLANNAVSGYVVEYAVNASETVAPTTGWSTATPTRTPGTYIWFRTTVTRNDGTQSVTSPALLTGNDGAQGDQGPQGVPGPTGADGEQLYTWIKYADSPTTGMADTPTGKAYLGLAYNKTTQTESTSYSDYSWSLIQGADGADGVQGPPGTDGQTTYTWVKYGTSAAGAGISDDPTGKTYIGLAYNKLTPTESSDPAQYTWSLIQGPAGADAATITLIATAQVLTAPATGGATTPATSTITGSTVNTTITAWEYSVNGAAWTSTPPAGFSRTGNVVTATGATMTARTIAVRMADANGVADTLTVAKSIDGATGATGATGGTGPAGADAYTVLLSNEAHSFPGSTTAALAGSTTSRALAYKAATQIAATIGTITGQVTGLTTSIQNNGTTTAQFTVTVTTSLTATGGTLTVPVTADGVSFTKTFAWTVSRTGATGGTGATGVSVTAITPYWAQVAAGAAAPAQPSTATPVVPWSATEPAYAANTELYRTEKVTFSNATYSYTTVSKSSSYDAANAAMTEAELKNTVYRQTTIPWPDTDYLQHSDDVGDLWYDTSLGPGSAWEIVSKQLTSNVVTLTTADEHDITAGQSVAVIGVDETFNGVYTVTSVGLTTVSYAKVAANVALTAIEQGQGAVVQAQGVGQPVNRVFIWDGTNWNDARDTEVMSTTSTLNNAVTGQATVISEQQAAITALQQKTDDLTLTAYAADGRINISDYEPLPEDAFQTDSEGNQIPKNEGSLWLTRTRDRLNYVTNPSFEVDVTTGWAISKVTRTRVAVAGGAPDSTYAMRLVNDGTTTGVHYVYSNPRYSVAPGQNVIMSGYVQLEAGVGTGYQAVMVFYDGAGTQIAGAEGVVYGTATTIAADGSWNRLYASAKAPDNSATVAIRFYSPAANASDIWLLDAVLLEVSDKLGRYFDGDSVGGSWLGTDNLSESELDGGAVIRLFELADGGWVEKFWTAATISSVYAEKIIGADSYKRPEGLQPNTMDGALVADNSLSVDKQYADYVTASEVLNPGDLVNVWDNDGLFMVQRATAGASNMLPNPSFEVNTTGWTGNALSITRSTTWAKDGSYAAYLIPSGASTDSFMVSSDAALIKNGMKPGTTYTVSAYLSLSQAQSGSIDATRARRIVVYTKSPTINGGNYVTTMSDQAPNAIGDYRLSVTFTVPGDATEAFFRLYNGSSSAVSALFWDAVMLQESSTALSYTDELTLVTREAHGFVLDAAGVGDPVRVYHSGYNELMATPFLPGSMFLSTVPGEATTSPPQDVGTIVQQVGFAPNASNLNFNPGPVIGIT